MSTATHSWGPEVPLPFPDLKIAPMTLPTVPIFLEELSQSSNAEWDEYVDTHPLSTCYHHRGWQAVARHAYRLEAPFLIARAGARGPIQGILPLFIVPGPVQAHLTNGLFGAFGPVLAESPTAHAALVDRASRIFDDEKLAYFIVKGDTPEAPEFKPVDQWVYATLKLAADPQTMWDGFKKQIRNSVRKAEKSGLVARRGVGDVDAFYDILAENMHKKGSPIYGLDFMREILHAFGDRADVVTVWHGDRAVCGALVLEHRGTTYVPFASSRPAYLSMCPNNLLYWEIIRRACERGMHTLDFGQSLGDSGGLNFKVSWGAEVHPLRCAVRAAGNTTPKVERADPVVDLIVKGWQRLPRRVADWLGPRVCRRWLA